MDRQPESPVAPRAGKLTRRRLLTYGLTGAAGVAGAGSLVRYLLRRGRSATAAVVARGDAPTGRLWRQWLDRGWARPARHYVPDTTGLRCQLCPNVCRLGPGDRGRCRNRVNKDGKLYTLVYGNPCAFNNDPIEKKPLLHFLPTSWVFSIATSGCGFRCLNCQNWDISQRKPEETKDPRGGEYRMTPARWERRTLRDRDRVSMFPEDVVALAEHLGARSIAYTYSEPTNFYEYMYDTAKLARSRKLRNVWVTCGYINEKPLNELCEHLDAANVDLKSFSDDIYRRLNSGRLKPILETLKTLEKNGVWFEVTNLVVPGYTDDLDMIRRMCRWLLDNIGPDHPLHFSRFQPHHRLAHLNPTPVKVLLDARSAAMEMGLRYVYVGNVAGLPAAETTSCPACGKPVIERYGYRVRLVGLAGGKCAACAAPIAGVWS